MSKKTKQQDKTSDNRVQQDQNQNHNAKKEALGPNTKR